MINNSRVIAVIQARSGSKGIPNKNIFNLNGYPLISYTIYAASISKYIDEILVSTDSQSYADVAIKFGAKAPFLRIPELAIDTITSVDSLKWFIEKYAEVENISFKDNDIIIELPAVSPFRTASDIDCALEKLVLTNADSVISVVNTGEKHPTRLKNINNDLIADFTKEFPEPMKMSRRQDLTPCYIRNGAIYAMTAKTLLLENSRSGSVSRPFEMPENRSVNIDNEFDLLVAKLLIENGYCTNYPSNINIKGNKKFNLSSLNTSKKPNLLITVNIDRYNLKEFVDLNKFNFYYYPDSDLFETNQLLSSFNWDYWIPSPCPPYKIDLPMVSQCRTLKIISTPSTGSTHIDRNDLKKLINLDIRTLQNHPELCKITASSEWTFALILQSLRKAKSVEKSIRSGLWREDEERMRGSQLYGKSVGLIGFGRIGSNVARYAHAFNMRVHAYDIDDSIIYPDYVNKENSIVDVATLSDVFCVCVHLTESTKQLIDSTIIELFKSDVIVVNTSRGEVIDEALLFKKLQEGKIGGLALDVLDNEVNYKKSQIYKRRNEFDNLILTPHIAGLSEESEKLAFKIALSNLLN